LQLKTKTICKSMVLLRSDRGRDPSSCHPRDAKALLGHIGSTAASSQTVSDFRLKAHCPSTGGWAVIIAEFPGNNPSDRVRLEERWGRSSERWRHVRDGSLEFKPAMTVNNRVGYVSPECVRTSAKYCAPSFIPLTVSAYYPFNCDKPPGCNSPHMTPVI
jgi:hypothetical protein